MASPIDVSDLSIDESMPMTDTITPADVEEAVPRTTGDPVVDYALFKIQRYAQSTDVADRRYFAKGIGETAVELGEQAEAFVNPVLTALFGDTEDVKIELMPQLGTLFELLPGNYEFLVSAVIPWLKQEIYSQYPDTKQAASEAFADITKILTAEDRGVHVLTFLLALCHEDEDEDQKLISIELLDQLNPLFGRELCEQFVTTEFISLSDDQRFKVRSAVAQNLISLSTTVSSDNFTSKILPIYFKLANDPIWRVRKSCVESIVGISQACPRDVRKETMVGLLSKFTTDSSRWVKTAACQQLGPFIAAMAGENIHEDLIRCYLDIVDNTQTQNSMDGDTIYHCAYNFPAVLLTLGPERWRDLRIIYKKLAGDSQARVRKTIAASIYEVARIIGCERTEEDLLKIYERILKDELMVKREALQNISRFVRVLTPPNRDAFLPVFGSFRSRIESWRLRYQIAKQLDEIVYLYPNTVVMKHILPIILSMTEDNVFHVRESAATGFGALFLKLLAGGEPDPKLAQALVDKVLTFVNHAKYVRRKMAIPILHKIAENTDLFNKYCNEMWSHLCNDPVPNIRYCCAKVAAIECQRSTNLPIFKRTLLRLKRDEDVDVRIAATQFDRQASVMATILAPPLQHADENFLSSLAFDEIIEFSGLNETMPTFATISTLEEELDIDDSGHPSTLHEQIEINIGKIDLEREVQQQYINGLVKKLIALSITFSQ